MKIRQGFVSNSSSCSFTIRNTTDQLKTLIDFVIENAYLLNRFNEEYKHNYSMEEFFDSASGNNIQFPPNSSTSCIFGDAQGTLIGSVFDYILRDGGSSESFEWNLEEMLR